MIHKWVSNFYDSLLYLGIIFSLLFFFGWYWNAEYQIRHAELVLQSFLDGVSSEGKIDMVSYDQMVRLLDKISADYQIEMIYTEYIQKPVYALHTEDELVQYYMNRNRIHVEELVPEEFVVEEEAEELCLQKETAMDLLAAENAEYLPLPEQGKKLQVEAVRNYQEVYEGEEIITLCKVAVGEEYYYTEAKKQYGTHSGEIILEVTIGEEVYFVPIAVSCYPRKINCEYGHEVVNSKKIIQEKKETGKISCPYCKEIPDMITVNTPVLYKRAGTELQNEVWLTVRYLDGHEAQITTDMEEWQDNYDVNYCGLQLVTVGYRGKEDSVIIISENEGCVQCGQECNERTFSDYMAFPYCIKCMSEVPLFTGVTYEEKHQMSNSELLATLAVGEIYMEVGNFLMLKLWKGNKCELILQNKIRRNGKNSME